jgi:hypothetical protein
MKSMRATSGAHLFQGRAPSLRLGNGFTLLGKFDGEFASHSSTYAGTVRYTW